jgi:RNA polymerase sigma factor (sigma-70 family)
MNDTAKHDASPATERSPLHFGELVSRNKTLVHQVLQRQGVAGGDVDDAAQRVFLTACGKLGSIRAGSERAFLRALATREASHVRRTYHRRREAPDTALDDHTTESVRPDRLAVRKARATTLSVVLGGMQHDLRRVLLLVELEGHALGEVAASLGIPLGTCKSRLRRARADLTLRLDALPESVRALVRS